MDLDEDERNALYDLHLLTNKTFVYACNVSEDMMDTPESELKAILGLENTDNRVIAICAKLEADMVEMTLEERAEFLDEMGLITTGLDHLIKTSYDALGLQYYFTAGEMEVRAWTIHQGDTAPQAAGVIHTDFEKGFIRAEVIGYDDYVAYGTEAKVKEAGKMRVEGKNYIVKDGDVMHFLFNV